MHITKGVVFALPMLVSGRIWRIRIPADGTIDARLSQSNATSAPVRTAVPPEETSSWWAEVLELRQAPKIPAAPPVVAPTPVPVPVAPPAVPQAPALAPPAVQVPAKGPAASDPAAPVTATYGDSADFLTVQWIETTIGGTYSTWVPKTITFHHNAQSPAPRPGKGYIGMGTLTGEIGRTKTVVMNAAATNGPEWMKGVAVAVGAGLAGVLV